MVAAAVRAAKPTENIGGRLNVRSFRIFICRIDIFVDVMDS
jgi:hypothetical protein